MHRRTTERASLFLVTFSVPIQGSCKGSFSVPYLVSERIDSILLKQSDQENQHILRLIILPVGFLAKLGLPFWGH